MRISIIIATYNAEDFLPKCLNGIYDQDLAHSLFEVIVINDGSSDQTEQIILQFAKIYENLIYVSQSNQGVSVARNVGLDYAKGEYITFIDSDDEIEKNSLKAIVNKLEKNNLDILYPNIDRYAENGEHLGKISFKGDYDEIKSGFLQERRTYPPTFYRKEIVKNIRFEPTISFGEDTVFNSQVQSLAKRVSFSNIPYYKYTVRDNSLSKQGKSERTFRGFLKAIEEIRRFQQLNFKNDAVAKLYFNNVYEIFVTRILELSVMSEWDRPRYNLLVLLLKNEDLLYILDALKVKYPHVRSSFFCFKSFQKFIALKSQIYKLIYRA